MFLVDIINVEGSPILWWGVYSIMIQLDHQGFAYTKNWNYTYLILAQGYLRDPYWLVH